MIITEKKLLYLAAIGAASEANFHKTMEEPEIEDYYTELLDKITSATNIKELLT